MRFFLFTYLLFCSTFLAAQQTKTVRDIGMWTGLGVQYEFKDDYTFSALQDIRLNNSFTKVDKAISELGFAYKINKNFKLNSNLRFSLNQKKDNSYAKDLRYNFDLQFKVNLYKNLQLKYRLRFQQLFENALNLDRTQVGKKTSNLRNKIELNYTIKKHTIYTSVELFREFAVYRNPYFNKFRLQIGNEWENKIGKFDFALAYERELSNNHPLNFVFAKLYYTFKIKNE